MIWGERTSKVVWIISVVAQILNWAGITSVDFLMVWSCSTPIENALMFLIPDRYGEMAMRWWDRMEDGILKALSATWNFMKTSIRILSRGCRSRDNDPLLPVSV